MVTSLEKNLRRGLHILSLVCGVFAGHRNLFSLPLGVIGRLYSAYLTSNFYLIKDVSVIEIGNVNFLCIHKVEQ